MQENDTISRTEVKYIQLTDKLQTKVDDQQLIIKLKVKEIEDLSDTIDKFKVEKVRLSDTNEALSEKIIELENDFKEQELISEQLDDEVINAHNFIMELQKYIVEDEQLLVYLGKKADEILNTAYNSGLTTLKGEYLKDNGFPIPLLIQTENEVLEIATSNYKLKANGTDFKLTKINANKNGDKKEIQAEATNS